MQIHVKTLERFLIGAEEGFPKNPDVKEAQTGSGLLGGNEAIRQTII